MTRSDATIWVVAGVILVGILIAALGLGTLLKGIAAIAVALALLAGIAWFITSRQT